MTFLGAINAVLRRLRENEVVSTNSTDYSKLVGDFVNQAIHDCEHAWDWNVLRETITVTTVSGTDTYDFHTADTKIISAINETQNWYLRVIPAQYQHSLEYLNTPVINSAWYYSFQGKSGGFSQIRFYPNPNTVDSLRFLVVKNTSAYDLDGTDDSEVITLPELPIVLGAYAKAVSERGEDGGIGYGEADDQYRTALSDAIGLDAQLNRFDEVSWCVR